MPKRKKITPLLREPLTKKARAAIEEYVILQGKKKGTFLFVLVKACLEAERMRRADLYAWLEKHGYSWRHGLWRQE